MSSVTLKNIRKVYPIADDIKKKKKKAPKNPVAGVPDADFVPNLQITEEGVVAVQDFNLEIKDKEFVVLVGPSGCGKSTTLRMIAGLEEITDGELYIGDKLSNVVAPRDRNIAMVFQNYSLYPNQTVYKNVAFPLEVKHMPREEIEEKVVEGQIGNDRHTPHQHPEQSPLQQGALLAVHQVIGYLSEFEQSQCKWYASKCDKFHPNCRNKLYLLLIRQSTRL